MPPVLLAVVAVVDVVVAAVVDAAGTVPELVVAGGMNGNPSPVLNTSHQLNVSLSCTYACTADMLLQYHYSAITFAMRHYFTF